MCARVRVYVVRASSTYFINPKVSCNVTNDLNGPKLGLFERKNSTNSIFVTSPSLSVQRGSDHTVCITTIASALILHRMIQLEGFMRQKIYLYVCGWLHGPCSLVFAGATVHLHSTPEKYYSLFHNEQWDRLSSRAPLTLIVDMHCDSSLTRVHVVVERVYTCFIVKDVLQMVCIYTFTFPWSRKRCRPLEWWWRSVSIADTWVIATHRKGGVKAVSTGFGARIWSWLLY